MARILKPGEKAHNLTIDKQISSGGQATCYAARSRDGRRVFLKQYRLPSQRSPWYAEFVKYQIALRARIDASNCRRFCYKQLGRFEEKTLFQYFEFLESSHSLTEALEKTKKLDLTPEKRLILARVLTAALAELHDQGIVHADLKPDNIMLIPDPEIAAGFRLLLIDMDFSLMTDLPAPWHGQMGYFGSPNYFSPEHLRGETPGTASDVFTAALILHQLLGEGHPLSALSDDEYSSVIQEGKIRPIKLRSRIDIRRAAEFVSLIQLSLHADPAKRPTARDLNNALNGAPLVATPQLPSTGAPCLTLTGSAPERTMRCNLSTMIGRRNVKRLLDDDYGLYSSPQFALTKADETWTVADVPGTTHPTLLNGKVLRGTKHLRSGDRIAIRESVAGAARGELTVSFLPVSV